MLLLNVQFHQFHRSHVTYKVKFCHNLSKTIWRHLHLVKIYLFQNFPWKQQQPKLVRRNSVLTSSISYFYVQQYIMPTGDVRRSQSTISFSFTKKQNENTTSQRPTKRPREDPERATPTIIVNQASTATITEESVNRNQNFLNLFQ